MTLDQIEVFKQVVEAKSFRGAGERLRRAQSAISYAIKNLEEELGFQLFDRTKYRANLTVQGEAFYRRTHGLFQSMKDLDSYAKTLRQGCEPLVRLSVSSILPLKPILKGFDQLTWRFPQTQIKLVADTLGADQLLIGDEVDIAVTEIKGATSEIESLPLGTISLVSVTGKASPLGKSKTRNQAQDFLKTPQIVLRSSTVAPQRSAGVMNPSNTWSVGDLSSKKELLLAGLGWGSMPLHMIKDELNTGELIQIRREVETVAIYLTALRSKIRGPSAQFLWDIFKQIDKF